MIGKINSYVQIVIFWGSMLKTQNCPFRVNRGGATKLSKSITLENLAADVT